MRLILAAILTAMVIGVAAPASAQTPQRIGARIFGDVDFNSLAAKDSFDAVMGTSQMLGWGVGGDITSLWKQLFVRIAVSHMKKDDGSRVFLFNNEAISLGIPLRVTMTPVELAGGWRFRAMSNGRLTPYVGGGALALIYKEESDFAEPSENISQTSSGGVIFGGVEFDVWKYVTVGAEAQYRSVPDAIGLAGVSEAFDETDLGGFTIRVMFGIRR